MATARALLASRAGLFCLLPAKESFVPVPDVRETRFMVCSGTSAALAAGLAALVRLRLADGSTVSGIAARAGLSQPCLSNWLCGRRALSLESLDSLRIAIGAGWCELLSCHECHSARVSSAARVGGVVVMPRPVPSPASRAWKEGAA